MRIDLIVNQMSNKYEKYIALILITTCFLCSCRIIQPYHSPQLRTDSLYRDVTTTDTTTIADLHWNQLFTDSILQGLISAGITQNLDLRIFGFNPFGGFITIHFGHINIHQYHIRHGVL